MLPSDPYGLDRFVTAQDEGGTYARALAELRRGRKTSHWMWFVFPQIAGLGMSPTSQHFAVRSVDEARAYLAHPVLGPRLRESCAAVLEHSARPAAEILGGIDAVKLQSSATLFELADPDEPLFAAVLDAFYAGARDERTCSSPPDVPNGTPAGKRPPAGPGGPTGGRRWNGSGEVVRLQEGLGNSARVLLVDLHGLVQRHDRARW